MNLFWQEQKKLFQRNPKGMRLHPMIIKFCLSLASKSKSAYEELRNSNILKLPSTRTLTDYKNLIKPKGGFRSEILDNLKSITSEYFDVEKYVVLLFDEMKIRSNLVFPSGHKDVRKTSKGRLFRTRGRPIRASNGRPLDGPNATRYVRPNWTSLDVQFGLALDVIVKPPKVKWTSKERLKTS